jgi:predicted DNA-binding WGR domain protein
MTALTLTRQDPERNMARYYRLDVQPDLFGGWALWREWGRIGRAGTVRRDPFADQRAAEAAQAQLAAMKSRRGYNVS